MSRGAARPPTLESPDVATVRKLPVEGGGANESHGGPWRAVLPLAAPLLVGAIARLANLRGQILIDDEIHAIRAALARPLRELLVTYQEVDHSIPLTALWRVLLDSGIPLSETLLRSPSVLAGLALLLAAPLWARRRLGTGVATVLAWLVAISPGLVFFSRVARSYLPMVLLCSAAVVALDAWSRRASLRSGAVFVLSAALATWLHLGASPLLVSGLLAAGGCAVTARRGRGATELVVLGAAAAIAVGLHLLPAHATLLSMARGKHGTPQLGLAEAGDTLRMQAGTLSGALAAIFWSLAAIGWWRLARRDWALALLAVTAAAGQAAGILLLAPSKHDVPLVLHRYLLPGLPWVLLGVAGALGWEWRGRWERWRPLAAAALVGALVATGPLADAKWWRTSFAHHVDYLNFAQPRPRLAAGRLPDFYRTLAAPGRAGPVLELPWHPFSRLSRSLYLYQEAHGQQVLAVPLPGALSEPRLAWRNTPPPARRAILASRARWLVVHRDLGREELRLRASRVEPRYRDAFRQAAARTVVELRREWGPAHHADRYVRAWDLDAVRATIAERGGGDSSVRAAASAAAAASTPARKPRGR
jgi:hypothetical protein